ncbi:MAG: DEAD/DEAH box helicase [Bacillus sp. (in: firmicutes)]
MSEFKLLGIQEELVSILQKQNIDTPTPVQEQAIPMILGGGDVMAQAQTGTGKTFAFSLPIIQMIDKGVEQTQALIVTPTRELALQITGELDKLTEGLAGVDVLAVYGGQDVDRQLKKLSHRQPQIIVATPGRLLDHIRRGTVDLSGVNHLVLDEADQMLHIGFLPEVEAILDKLPAKRQTLLFSATIPKDVRKLAKGHMVTPAYIQVEKKQGPAETVEQHVYLLTDRAKQNKIMELINKERPFMAVLFCRTKRRVSKLYEILKSNGYSVEELHGDLSQAKRERVMKRFRDAEFQLLVATDVAARGLDVEGVTHVFNYDIPEDAESYVHRIGRTGRAGMEGKAITFYSPKDRSLFESLEKELSFAVIKHDCLPDRYEEDKHVQQKEPSGKTNRNRTYSGKKKPFNGKRKQQSGSKRR